MLQEGASELDVANAHFSEWCRYHKAFLRYAQLSRPSLHRPHLQVLVLLGKTGLGKSSLAGRLGNAYRWSSRSGQCYFDDYQGEDVLLLDEFVPGCIPKAILLRLLDPYPYNLPCRYSDRGARYNLVIITTNYPISEWYEYTMHQPQDTINRRVSFVFFFSTHMFRPCNWICIDDIPLSERLYFEELNELPSKEVPEEKVWDQKVQEVSSSKEGAFGKTDKSETSRTGESSVSGEYTDGTSEGISGSSFGDASFGDIPILDGVDEFFGEWF